MPVASTMSCRLAEVAAAFNLTTNAQIFGVIFTKYFPWDATMITALSKRYKNTRNDNVARDRCFVNEVGVLA